jgi:hypothetical protein
MTREKIELLQEELLGLQLAAGHLGYSIERCRQSNWNAVNHSQK